MNTKLVIFDLDGTIYKSETTYIPAILSSLKDFGLPPLAPEDILPFLRYNTWEYSQRILGSDDPDRIESFRKKVRVQELSDIPAIGTLFPGVETVLEELHGLGCEMAICTNAENNYLNAVVEKTGIGHFFTVLAGNDSGVPKADLVRDLLVSTGYSSEKCVLLGDSESDQTAAAGNGVVFIEAAWGYGNATIENALHRIGDISELPGLLKSSFGLMKGTVYTGNAGR